MKLILINPLKVINYSYIKLEYDNFKSTQNNTKKTYNKWNGYLENHY